MADPEQIARWTRVEQALRVALMEMRPALDAEGVAWVEEFLDHNELGVAMETLVSKALESAALELPRDALSHLRLASAEMDGFQPDQRDEFVSRLG